MYPLWDRVIQPTLEAAGARRVVEIGALQGETTVKLLDLLGPDAELHVIDPVPQFDPSEHERRFPGRYHFHRDTSHNVLPTLPAMDAALIDGDHNWYTVYNELKMLAAVARDAGAPLPILFLHDVGWPYGRRDLYYAPERIPEEFRQPYARKGIAPGNPGLRPDGGLNRQFNNAMREGGPRNGVMAALEDFAAGHDAGLRIVTVPVCFGLAIVAEESRLAGEPRLAEALAEVAGVEGRRDQAELAESLRVRTVIEARMGADDGEARVDRAMGRYLEVVKAALLDEHYLENEVRLDYLHQCASEGAEVDPLKLRDLTGELAHDLRRLRAARRTGAPLRTLVHRPLFPYTSVGRSGLDHLEGCLEAILDESIPGDLAAFGVWRGGTAIFMRAFLEACDGDQRMVWVVDSFAGPPQSAIAADPELSPKRFPNLVADATAVREGFARFGLLDERVRFLQGSVADALADAPIGELALLHLGDEHEEPTAAALERLYDRLSPGGFVIVAHNDAPGCRRAVNRFRRSRGINAPVTRVDWAGATWRKPMEAPVVAEAPSRTPAQLNRVPLVGPAPGPRTELSVVVVFYDMKREAARTLYSLSRPYQRGIEDLAYEVIVVENGSHDDEKLSNQFVRGFGPEFRYLDLAADATPSPAHALNRGIEIARGESVALMIDGAHVLTPGVLHYGTLGLRTYEPAIAATHQCYLGPRQQGEAMDAGYDEDYENRLLNRIRWPEDGYRLFEIGSFIGDRDWFDGLWESNCLFTSRELLEQVGGLDESFSMPGGGYTNLDLFERLGGTPGVTVVGILGEASFHQLHGGTTTNQPDDHERHARLMSYREHFEGVRGRPWRGPGKPRHFVGAIRGAALRTRPRWMTAPAFREAQRVGSDGFPREPAPVPEQLQAEFTDAFWRSFAWRDVAWLGRRIEQAPTDVVAYQELIAQVRPEWIIELRAADGARGTFFASICELLGSGRVLCVQADPPGERVEHPRITYLAGEPTAEETRKRVFETVGAGAGALVIIPAADRQEVVAEFRAYEPLVGTGSYVIVENSILNGHPVLPEHGPGPAEAIQIILREYDDFTPDHRPERFSLTFNPRGFLKRVQ